LEAWTVKPVISVRAATLADSKDVFDWRNDAVTRRMSYSSDVVAWDAHSAWFAATLDAGNRLLLICVCTSSEAKCAVVRFDVTDHTALISINLAPSERGKGLAKPCLFSAIDTFQQQFPDVSLILAEVKVENSASRRLFEGAGFRLLHEADGVLTFERRIGPP